jgi:hypothetical protein
VVSVRPLYTPAEIEKPHLDDRLEGDWVMAQGDEADGNAASQRPPCRVSILKSPKGDFPYIVSSRCPGSGSDPGEEYREYDLHLVPLETATFFDARFTEFRTKEKKISRAEIADDGIILAHFLGQVWIQQDFVRFAPLESGWIESNWPADFLVSDKLDQYSKVDVLTNPTPALRQLVSRNAASQGAFSLGLYLCRAGTDCIGRAIEDQIHRTPHDREVLDGSVRFYAKRGDFARAIALLRHKMELTSEASDQFELCRLLLIDRDFDCALGARSAAKDILSYFALHRLGQSKEAESYLRDQVAAFTGPAQEHLFLLQVLGRVTDSWPSEDWGKSTFYYALNSLKNGDREVGRSHLQDLARLQPKDSLVGLTAQVELDRLASSATK